MPFMRISQGQRYAKKGTPKEREQDHFQQLADDIFAELLLRSSRPERRKRGRVDHTGNKRTQTAETSGVENPLG
jgi:hypothetical protein